jgi:hypothetical protein
MDHGSGSMEPGRTRTTYGREFDAGGLALIGLRGGKLACWKCLTFLRSRLRQLWSGCCAKTPTTTQTKPITLSAPSEWHAVFLVPQNHMGQSFA